MTVVLRQPLRKCDRCKGSGQVVIDAYNRNDPRSGVPYSVIIACPQWYCHNGYVKECKPCGCPLDGKDECSKE